MNDSTPKDMWDDADPVDAPVNRTIPQSAPPSSTPAPSILATSLPSAPRSNRMGIILIGVAALLVTGLGFWLIQSSGNVFTPEPENEETETPENVAPVAQVTWQEPQKVPSLKVLVAGDAGIATTQYFKVGTFFDGPYNGGELFVATILTDDPAPAEAMPAAIYRFVKTTGGELVLLLNNSADYEKVGIRFDTTTFTTDALYTVDELAFPDEIANPLDPAQRILLVPAGQSMSDAVWFSEKRNLREMFSDEIWGVAHSDNIATSSSGQAATGSSGSSTGANHGFYFEAPDGTLVTYALLPPFINRGALSGVSWLSGSNGTDYIYNDQLGCQFINFASVMPASVEADLAQAGSVTYGTKTDNLWSLADGHKLLTAASVPVDPAVVAAEHGVFFWKDAFGRIIKFTDTKYLGC